jgi:lysophospholipase L1-like esterase
MNPAMTPAPAPSEETPTPSDSMAAAGGEAPMGSVPLDSPPAPADMEGSGDNGGAEGETPAPDDGAAELPPAAEPPDEPVPPLEFNPCPTDGTPCRIMPLGDSITFGLGSSNQAGYRLDLFELAVTDGHAITFVGRVPAGPTTNVQGQSFPTNNEGYSGSTINDGNNQLANRVDPAINANPPHIVLLMIGTNDVFQQVNNPPSDLGSLLDQITDGAPDALLVVAQIVPGQQAAFNQRVQTYNATIPGLVQERVAEGKHLVLVDMFTPFVSNPGGANALLNDFVHPNDAGYAVMADTWYEAIESFLP